MAAATLAERTSHTGAVALNYVVAGPEDARPLVLLHGGSARWQACAPIIPALATTRRVYAIDLRGHGRSGWATGHYRLRDHADDLLAFLRGCVGRPAAVFGHSLGGQVALVAAADGPGPVCALMVGDAPLALAVLRDHLDRQRPRTARWRDLAGPARPPATIAAALRDAPTPLPGRDGLVRTADWLGEDNPWFDLMAAGLHRIDPDTLTAVVDRFEETHAGYDLDLIVPRLACPTLLLQADPAEGGMLTDGEIARARALAPTVAAVRLDGIGHGLQMGEPGPVLRAIVDFLDEHDV